MKTHDKERLQDTKLLMGALVRMKPKAHEDMKLGRKTNDKKAKSPARKRASAKPKTSP